MKVLGVTAAAIVLSGAAAEPTSPSFCARLGPQIGLKQTDDRAVWQGRLVSGLKAAFLGGSGGIGFSVEGVGETPEDQATLRRVCTVTKGDARCAIDRPMILIVSSTIGDGSVTAQAGERAVVETKGVRVRCTDQTVG